MAALHRIRIVDGAEFDCGKEERVLIAMERSGADDIGVGCRGGGCGICRIRVVGGDYKTGKMSAEKVSEVDRAAGFALACRLYPEADLLIEVE
ncbi:MAG: ferredoxin [Novosphingobium sp.]|nr:ferredoxin [Novosphingobium sp.]